MNNNNKVFLIVRMSRTTYVMRNMRCCVDVREELGSKPSKFLPHSCSLWCVEDVGLRSESFPPTCNRLGKWDSRKQGISARHVDKEWLMSISTKYASLDMWKDKGIGV